MGFFIVLTKSVSKVVRLVSKDISMDSMTTSFCLICKIWLVIFVWKKNNVKNAKSGYKSYSKKSPKLIRLSYKEAFLTWVKFRLSNLTETSWVKLIMSELTEPTSSSRPVTFSLRSRISDEIFVIFCNVSENLVSTCPSRLVRFCAVWERKLSYEVEES